MSVRKLLIVVSPGGHLFKMTRLRSWWQQFDHVWVSDIARARSLLGGEKIISGYFPENRHFLNAFRNFLLAWHVIIREKPDLVVSTGAGIAVPFFVVGKLLGVKLIFIETFMFIAKPTLTGRLLYPLVDEFVVQHKGLLAFYPKAHLAEMNV